MTRHPALLLILLFACLVPSAAWASDPVADGRDAPIVTDRPTFGASPETVGALHAQIETGVDIAVAGDLTLVSVPTKLRFGVWGSHLELHVESAVIQSIHGDEAVEGTFGAPLDVGFKARFVEGSSGSARPSLALLAALTIPTETGDWALSPTLAAAWSFGDSVSLGPWINLGTTHALSTRGDGADLVRAALGTGLGFAAVAPLSLFGEFFVVAPLDGTSDPAAWFDGGAALLLSPALQLDLYGRVRFTGPTEWGAGLGISYKI